MQIQNSVVSLDSAREYKPGQIFIIAIENVNVLAQYLLAVDGPLFGTEGVYLVFDLYRPHDVLPSLIVYLHRLSLGFRILLTPEGIISRVDNYS